MKRKVYEKELRKLQVELCHVQEWVKAKGARIIVIFEGRDAAGKGGTIKAITERVSPRVFQVVALPAPSDREKTQMYVQRYIRRFPAAGEIVIFDRSWYNRAGVENVMGFVDRDDVKRFLDVCPEVREIRHRRRHPPDQILAGSRPGRAGKKVFWRASTIRFANGSSVRWILKSYSRWYDYSRARDAMFKATDTDRARWHIVRSDDKRRARLNCISQLLELIPYKKVSRPKVKLPKRSRRDAYNDQATLRGRHFVAEKF